MKGTGGRFDGPFKYDYQDYVTKGQELELPGPRHQAVQFSMPKPSPGRAVSEGGANKYNQTTNHKQTFSEIVWYDVHYADPGSSRWSRSKNTRGHTSHHARLAPSTNVAAPNETPLANKRQEALPRGTLTCQQSSSHANKPMTCQKSPKPSFSEAKGVLMLWGTLHLRMPRL